MMMRRVVVARFGEPEVLEIVEEPLPQPGPGEVRIALTSIGMNHADLMARRGEYKLSSGEPPFTPGLEGGGRIEALGDGVHERRLGQQVILTADAPRLNSETKSLAGTYRSHVVAPVLQTLPAPDVIPDEQLGTLWLAYLTAWGCLVWKQSLREGQTVGIPAASSSVGLAAAQVARAVGAIPIGLTTSAEKVEKIRALPKHGFEHLVVTSKGTGRPTWHRELLSLTGGKGVDVFFDPVASGDYLNTEIRALAQHGTIWVYGLLGEPGTVDVTPLIRKHASIRGWVLGELLESRDSSLYLDGYRWILQRFADGTFRQHIAKTFRLADVVQAHQEMEKGTHIGKLVLVP